MKRNSSFKKQLISWSFVALPTLFIAIFYFYPMVQSFLLSLMSGAGANLEFVGLENYKRLLEDRVFWQSLGNTLLFFMVQVPTMILLSIFFSVILHQQSLKFKGLFRTIFFLPCVTSLVAYSIVFKSLFSNDGIINKCLEYFHIIQEPLLWLSDPLLAKIVIILAITWRWTGYNMIFFLAALNNIDPEIYEAAAIDGATRVDTFFKLTVPLLKPVILFSSITSTIGTLQLFAEPMNITDGGPAGATMTISQYIYNISFKYTPDFGYATAISYIIVVLVIVFSAIQRKAVDKK